jgi:hypothetical protein
MEDGGRKFKKEERNYAENTSYGKNCSPSSLPSFDATPIASKGTSPNILR